MAVVETPGPSPSSGDPRTGVLHVMTLIEGSEYTANLRRLEGQTLTPITPDFPEGDAEAYVVRSFDGGAWVGRSMDAIRLSGGAWVEHTLEDCEPAGGHIYFSLVEAVALDDAWGVAFSPGDASSSTLCHFDGAAWSAEEVPFSISALAALDDVFLAYDSEATPARVMRRPRTGGAWEPLDLGGDVIEFATVHGGVVVAVTDPGSTTARSLLTSGEAREQLGAEIVVGIGGDHWEVEVISETGEHCGVGLFGGEPRCVPFPIWAQYIIHSVDGASRTEAAHADLWSEEFGSETTALAPIAIGPGRLGLYGNAGGFWITP